MDLSATFTVMNDRFPYYALISYRQTTIAERFPALNEYHSIQQTCLIEGSSFLHQSMSRPQTST